MSNGDSTANVGDLIGDRVSYSPQPKNGGEVTNLGLAIHGRRWHPNKFKLAEMMRWNMAT